MGIECIKCNVVKDTSEYYPSDLKRGCHICKLCRYKNIKHINGKPYKFCTRCRKWVELDLFQIDKKRLGIVCNTCKKRKKKTFMIKLVDDNTFKANLDSILYYYNTHFYARRRENHHEEPVL